jgi:hypothetical protein
MSANLDIITFHPFIVPKEFPLISFQTFQVPQKSGNELNSQKKKTFLRVPEECQSTLLQRHMLTAKQF